MDFFIWLQVAFICLLGAMSPGPSLLFVARNTLHGGLYFGIMTSLGHGVGVGAYSFSAVIGLSILIDYFPQFNFFMSLSGAAILIFFAVQIWFKESNQTLDKKILKNEMRGFGGGLIVALINPKIVIFFIAIFSQFITFEVTWLEKTVLAATAGVIDFCWYAVITLSLSHERVINYLSANINFLNKSMSVLLFFIALNLLFEI